MIVPNSFSSQGFLIDYDKKCLHCFINEVSFLYSQLTLAAGIFHDIVRVKLL